MVVGATFVAFAALTLGGATANAQIAPVATTTTTTTSAPTIPADAAVAVIGIPSVGTVSWSDGAASTTLTVVADPAVVTAGDLLHVVMTWTYVGPTPFSPDAESKVCADVLGRSTTRTITNWRPVLYFGTTADLSQYTIGDRLDGPWLARATSTAGSGRETLTPTSCSSTVPVAKTVRVYDVSYVVPELPSATYSLLTPDFGFNQWWTGGAFPTVDVTPATTALVPPLPTPDQLPAGAGVSTTTRPATSTSMSTSSTTTSTVASSVSTASSGAGATTGGSSETTTSRSAAPPSTATTVGRGSTTTTTTTAAGATSTGPEDTADDPLGLGAGSDDDDPGAGSGAGVAVDVARATIGVLAALVAIGALLLGLYSLTPNASPGSVGIARRAVMLSALAAATVIGLSVFTISFDAALAVAVGALGLDVLAGLSTRVKPSRSPLFAPGIGLDEARRMLDRGTS